MCLSCSNFTTAVYRFFLTAGILLPFAAESWAQLGPVGFDNFGHIGNLTPVDLRDIRTTGTQLSLFDDQSVSQSLGFDFDFYGTSFNSVNVSSNGFLSFTNTSPASVSEEILAAGSAAAPENLIAAAWTDLDPPDGGDIFVETRGPVGNREFVVGYYDVNHFVTPTSPTLSTFEVILHEGSNNIEFQYGTLTQQAGAEGSSTPRERISIGIQNADRSDALPVAFFPENSDATDTVQVTNQGYRITTLTDIGQLGPMGGGLSPARQRLDRGEVRWFRFDLAADATVTANRFLSINTNGSRLTLDGLGLVDTEIGLYDANGNLVANDDDSGIGRLSELRFGDGGVNGNLNAGTYFLSASAFNTGYGAGNFDVESTSPQTGEVEVNLVYGIDIGTLSNGTVTTPAEPLASGEAQFYQFVLTDAVYGAYGDSLVIDTVGSNLNPSSDTELGLYDAQGNLIANDDDGGLGTIAELSFGVNGSDGDLPAGTYYLTASGFNTFFSDDFNATVSSTRTGDIVLNLNLDNVAIGEFAGDFDGNGLVNGHDFLTWQRGLGTVRTVNELPIWEGNFGNSLPLQAPSQAVPEPTTWTLMLLVGAMALCRQPSSLEHIGK